MRVTPSSCFLVSYQPSLWVWSGARPSGERLVPIMPSMCQLRSSWQGLPKCGLQGALRGELGQSPVPEKSLHISGWEVQLGLHTGVRGSQLGWWWVVREPLAGDDTSSCRYTVRSERGD